VRLSKVWLKLKVRLIELGKVRNEKELTQSLSTQDSSDHPVQVLFSTNQLAPGFVT
jgi:hypothetical protein